MMKRSRALPLALALAVLPMAGCIEDEVVRPLETDDQRLFARYVSLGNSITAGFQSGGINDSTQNEAYPVLLAEAADVAFNVPSLANPGCPPPLRDPFSGQRISPVPCALRNAPEPGPIQNVAVPGAKIVDAFNNLLPKSSANALTSFILGGRTQLEAALDADPTLVSVWLGNNDALGAALSGDVSRLTPLAEFTGSLETLAEGLEETPAAENDAVVFIGAALPNVAAPALQPGGYFFAARDANGRFLGREVLSNCSPFIPADATGTTFRVNPLAQNLVSFLIATDPQVTQISCAPDAPYVLNTTEQAEVTQRVLAFNAAIAAEAESRGWLFLDPNALLAPFLGERRDNIFFNRIRACQAVKTLLAGTTGTFPVTELQARRNQFAQAVGVSCPVPPTVQGAAPNFFGSFVSFDGVHPTGEAHRVIANALATLLNERFGTELPLLDIPAIR